ncbi:MAG: FAD:protein FMN transferase [Clostridia bacterium]|nr:FAD:protein FMN transferase [Clostridia bacterium]
MKRIFLTLIILITLVIIPQTGCNNEEPISKTDYCLDTVCQIDIYEGGDEELIDQAFKLCRHYEDLLSKTIKTSDIYRINQGEKVKVDEDTLEVIKKGLYYSKLSKGTFDITVGPITDLWDFHAEEPVVPEEKDLAEAVKHIGYGNILIEGNTVSILDGKIDLGAIAKGYICDKVTAFLKDSGVTSGVVNLGGNIAVIGQKNGKPFKVGIERPYSDRTEIVGLVEAEDKTLVTSGIYERCFKKDGKVYHHILDPKTGYPVDSDIESVTIISSLGRSVDCDGLSTLCLTLGVKDATKLIESIDGVEAVFIDRNDKITQTSGAHFEKQ